MKKLDSYKQYISSCFDRDIDIILDILPNELEGNLISIYLYGGYGRNEGSWLLKDKCGNVSVSPYNDYDIAIILKEHVDVKMITHIETSLKAKINIKWIDISQYTISDLENLSPLIKNFDLKYASKWLYGKKDVLDNIVDINAENIALKDIEILYATRLWTLIGSFNSAGLVAMEESDEIFFRNQMAKCILAIVDCVLLQRHNYHYSYKERVRKLPDFTSDDELLDLSQWALEEKLFPKYVNMSDDEVRDLYERVNKLFFGHYFLGLSRCWGVNINSIEDVEKYLLFSPVNIFKRIIKNYVYQDKSREKGIMLVILQGYIAYYYFDNNEIIFNKLKKVLSKYFNDDSSESFDAIRIKVANLRLGL